MALGLALRGEYVDDEDSFFSGLGLNNFAVPGDSTELWSVTGTADYALTEQLMVRAEVRWDTADLDNASDEVFFDRGAQPPGRPSARYERDQIVAGVEVLYNF